ncbi:MAG: substrate-binding domain-containing protein [Spirochaetales bacterium]|nr:substrate-binding domain-containing protein [Spirochaetales bacterium]
MIFSEDRLLILWGHTQKEIPRRPAHPGPYPETDARHWYDMEYAGWGVRKRNIPQAPGMGAQGARVLCLRPHDHPYWDAYGEGAQRIADLYHLRLEERLLPNDQREQHVEVRRAIADCPHLIVLVPDRAGASAGWFREINEAGIPVIASNRLPADEVFPYVLAWTGPDDWGQTRLLARTFAKLMDYQGGYCIVEHYTPGSSCYYARTWGMITELEKVAPRMQLLARCSAEINPAGTRKLVAGWLMRFGGALKGIVSADDNVAQQAINEAICEAGRPGLVRVAVGTSPFGMRAIREGRLNATTYQADQADGALALKTAVDWLEGLTVDPIYYLPTAIITRENVEEFLRKRPEISDIDLGVLYRSVIEQREDHVDRFFEHTYQKFIMARVITVEYFRGFSIEVLSNLIHILKMNDIDEKEIFGDWETLYKSLFNRRTLENTMDWLKKMSKQVMRVLSREQQVRTPIQKIVAYVDRNLSVPMSLKILSCQFGLSAAYLGQLFRKETGRRFSDYVNELRIRRACEMFRYTSLRANQVAEKVGFSDPDYFYDVFRKYTGVYPTQFRNREL